MCVDMDIKIKRAETLPNEIKTLAAVAEQEDYPHIHRLIEEYQSGKNVYAAEGECLLLAYDGQKLIACGCLNQQWNDTEIETRIGRVRRFFVHPKYRQHGVGKLLLSHLEQQARPHYSALCLHTTTKGAVSFYQKQNYVFVESHPNYNYFKYLI